MANVKLAVWIISIITVLCLADSIIIEIQKSANNGNQPNFCSIVDKNSNCLDVQNSQYGKIFGFDNAIYGIIGFALLLISSLLYITISSRISGFMTAAGGTIAGIMGIWFIYVQSFILKAFCSLCMIVDILSIILLIPSIYLFIALLRKNR